MQRLPCDFFFPLPGCDLLYGGRLPDSGRVLIPVASDDAPAIGRKGDRLDGVAVSLEREELLAGGRVPQFDRQIYTAARNTASIG